MNTISNLKHEFKTDSYKMVCEGTLKNGLPLITTFEVNFKEPVDLNSDTYKSVEKEIREIITTVSMSY